MIASITLINIWNILHYGWCTQPALHVLSATPWIKYSNNSIARVGEVHFTSDHFVVSKHTLSNPCVARILFSACHRKKNIFQMWLLVVIPGIPCNNNEVESKTTIKFFSRSASYFYFDCHSFLYHLFQTPW